MATIDLTEQFFKINTSVVSFPIPINILTDVLGASRHVTLEHNTVYTWDDLGLMAYSKNGQVVEGIVLALQPQRYEFSPKQMFSGNIIFDGHEAVKYYTANRDKRVKLFKADTGGALVLNGTSLWFDVDDGQIQAIEVSSYEDPASISPAKPLPVDLAFKYLEPLWADWITATTELVAEDNQYYNLTHGISAEDISKNTQLAEFEMPQELLNFYKIHNVDYNAVTATYSFFINGWQYDLLPFAQIREEWLAIQDLANETIAAEHRAYSTKVNATTYANAGWIPLAEGRNGDYLLYDTDPSKLGSVGQIIELQNEAWTREVVADSLAQLVRNDIALIKRCEKDFSFILG